MFSCHAGIASVLALAVAPFSDAAPLAPASWVGFDNETATRLAGAPAFTVFDTSQKAYAWGDVDLDGDLDLVVVRKFPVAPGKEPNVLFINEDGTLTDRTDEFATDSAVEGDQGFHTPTDDYHAVLVDVDLDGWLDIVTAVATSEDDPSHIGYPRVYRNKGCAGSCNGTADWLGFRYEPARIPLMLTDSGESGFNPCFSHVAAGDVNGDDYPDLWFLDRDGVSCGPDFNNKLLLNLGQANPGHFVDVSESNVDAGFRQSGTPASGWIADMNGDGLNDLVKQKGLVIDIAYNAPLGIFVNLQQVYTGSTYFVSLGDLNNDDRLDLVVSEDGNDSYLLNVETAPNGLASFLSFTYSFAHDGSGGPAGDDGFAANSYVADLNRDGWNDVLITDVDAEVSGCSRRMHIYRNLGGSPGDPVVLEEQTSGSGCHINHNNNDNPSSCIVTNIPASELQGVHDVAIFDINGDDWPDLVLGRCDTTTVYINQAPGPAAGSIDLEGAPGSQLLISKDREKLVLNWGGSCLRDDTDYAIYSGELALIGVHVPVVCSTGGATSHAAHPPAGDAYFLVIPHNGNVEGSYGLMSSGVQRPQGSPVCLPRFIAECP